MKKILLAIALAGAVSLLVIATPAPAVAQQQARSLQGQVTNDASAPVEGA